MPDRWSLTLWDAVRRHDHAAVLRRAREERGWSQGELGRHYGCSASTISRFENGRRALRDVAVLHRLAAILELPVEAFGLTYTHDNRHVTRNSTSTTPTVGHHPSHEGDDPVRRRAFLITAGLAGTVATAPDAVDTADALDVDPAAFLARRLEETLLVPHRTTEIPTSVKALQEMVATQRAHFHACRYVDLATRLPNLLTTAEATHHNLDIPATANLLAQTYNLATRALIKLDASGLEWLSADRAVHVAHAAEDPVALAEAQRLLGSTYRRAGYHGQALTLTLTAAGQLDLNRRHPDEHQLEMYGMLLCSAGYAAARAGDQDRTTELLNEATTAVTRLSNHPIRQRALAATIASHRVSSARVLGNAGQALRHAKAVPIGGFANLERRARFMVDVALSLAQCDKPDRAYHALLAAERIAPHEVHTRATARRLITDLIHTNHRNALSGVRALAARAHIPN